MKFIEIYEDSAPRMEEPTRGIIREFAIFEKMPDYPGATLKVGTIAQAKRNEVWTYAFSQSGCLKQELETEGFFHLPSTSFPAYLLPVLTADVLTEINHFLNLLNDNNEEEVYKILNGRI